MNVEQLKNKYLTYDFKLKGEYLKDQSERESVLEKCEKYAGWTIPSIFPLDPLKDSDELQYDYQSIGAQAVTNLANKVMMALFQPARPFFRMNLTKEQRAEVMSTGIEEAKVDAALADIERAAMAEMEATNARTTIFSVLEQLIITGDSILYAPKEGDYRAYSVRDYVIKRDMNGKPVRFIIKESKKVNSLGDELGTLAIQHQYSEDSVVSIYTCVQRVGDNRYFVWQELEDISYCHKAVGVYDSANLPWIPLCWSLARGNDYGTGLVELYAGDFHKLSTIAEAILDFTTVMTDVKNLVNPAGMTDVRELVEAPSGAYVYGREEDIFVHQPQVANVTDFLQQQFEYTARTIGAGFLLNSAVTRDAERVTAEEIRRQAHELESSLGGVYSRLANELQKPLASRMMKVLNPIFKDIEPVIVTGLDSLSRSSELDNFRAFMADLVAMSDVPPEVSKWMRYDDVIAILGAGHGVNYKKFMKDKKQVDAEQQQAMQSQAQMAGMEAGAVAGAEAQNGKPKQ